MSEPIQFLSLQQCLDALPEGDKIHTFTQSLMGADWERDKILELLNREKAEVAGPMALASGHGLCVRLVDEGYSLFIATREGWVPPGA